jgi:hypothetical protein
VLRDMGQLANITGLEHLAKVLKTNNVRALGFRYELEAAAYLSREGAVISEISKRIATSSGKTDIDIIADLGQGPKYLQVKRSTDALRYGETGLKSAQSWVAKAQKDLGVPPTDFSKVAYVVPPNTKIPPKIDDYFDAKGIEVIDYIPHL